ncbi:MAG: hypothetical protein K8R58_13615, partial [Bacteroidales bacterium]|nr:hypothetical protein [Bacteroidales bacterium]
TVLAIIFAMNLNATVWTVNNVHSAADFTTLQDAINGASATDTIYLEGSPNSYGDGTFDKQLVVIGTGYWLNENDTTQAYKQSSRIGNLIFNSGSEGTIITGIYLYKSYGSHTTWKLITINTDSITIQRSYISGYVSASYTYDGHAIYIAGNRSGIIIQQNWIMTQINDYSSSTNGTVTCIYFSAIPENIVIRNNFIRAYKSHSYGGYKAVYMYTNNATNELIINNNVMWGGISTYYSIHINNILVSGDYVYGEGNLTSNNLCNGTQYPNENNNQQNIDMSTVFIDYEKYIDNGYILANDSPAIGAGMDGGDCGAFGNGNGGDPYILSGLPAIPAIFESTITIMGSTSLPVNIKAISHN